MHFLFGLNGLHSIDPIQKKGNCSRESGTAGGWSVSFITTIKTQMDYGPSCLTTGQKVTLHEHLAFHTYIKSWVSDDIILVNMAGPVLEI